MKKLKDLRSSIIFCEYADIPDSQAAISSFHFSSFFAICSLRLTSCIDMSRLLSVTEHDFAQTWTALHDERMLLFDRRTELENELLEIRNKIFHIDEVLSHLGPLADIGFGDKSPVGLGITDAVRWILRNSNERLSPRDVHQQLIEKAYDLSGLSSPMASIYTILRRLENDTREVEREKEDGRVYYKWKVPPLTDEDIPF